MPIYPISPLSDCSGARQVCLDCLPHDRRKQLILGVRGMSASSCHTGVQGGDRGEPGLSQSPEEGQILGWQVGFRQGVLEEET